VLHCGSVVGTGASLRTEFTETLRVRLPPELSSAVAEAARKDLTSISEFARQALRSRVRDVGVSVEPQEATDAR
jgi:predicted HicB family RNase H-like nuclease